MRQINGLDLTIVNHDLIFWNNGFYINYLCFSDQFAYKNKNHRAAQAIKTNSNYTKEDLNENSFQYRASKWDEITQQLLFIPQKRGEGVNVN